jgi:hypothetical protein
MSSVIVYTHVSVGVFTRTPFFLFRLVDSTLQRPDEELVDAWPCFPGFKVRQMYLYSPVFSRVDIRYIPPGLKKVVLLLIAV